MKKFLAVVLIAVFVFQIGAKADEGMWFLAFINKNYKEMKAMGFKLSPKDIYDINHASMKDAVVTLDRGSCTAELVSSKGLLLTNHHCGFGEIQAHSSIEHDYLTNGFWAKNLSEELPNPSKTVTFLVRMEDVSDKVNAELNENMTEEERDLTIRKISEKIQKEAVGDSQYEANVISFFNGNNYYLFITETFRDIRLVGAPPSAIGKFGGDTDNWMWPRQTGDFSIFRIYCSPDGKPADYSPENVPYTPKHFFPISIKPKKKDDFAMIMGYPGRTQRYLTSWGVQETIDNENGVRIEVGDVKRVIMKKHMDLDNKIRLQYADKYYSGIMNYYKYSIGQNKALQELKVIDSKIAIEKEFAKWIEANKTIREPKYGQALGLMKEAYSERKEMDKVQNYWFEALYSGSELFKVSLPFRRLQYALESGNLEAIDGTIKEDSESMKDFFKDYNQQVDKELFVALMSLYKEKMAKEYWPSFFETIDSEYGKDIQKFADKVFETSIFTDESRMNAFFAKPDVQILNNDMGFQIAKSALDIYFNLQDQLKAPNEKLEKGMRKFAAGWIEMQQEKDKNKLYYPDANSTIRLSYGKIGGYKVGDKVYDFTTDLESLMKKEDPKNEEFTVPDRLKELYKAKDYGQYGENGKMIVCFTSNNDITGGNSGSPVLNGKGELIGLAFDGNWEAMSGDIAFDKNLQKTINVDIRYVLFIIDKYAGATNLIDEMTIVKK